MDSSAIEGNSEARKLEKQVHPRLSPDEYYYSPEGFLVFTETYHLNRGYCCKSQGFAFLRNSLLLRPQTEKYHG
jgi:hypothetical protein